MFDNSFFEGNRARLQAETDAKIIVLAANGLIQRSADTTFPFRQDSNFWYLTGIDEPDFVLVISELETFLIAPKREDHRDLWDGSLDKNNLRTISGIKTIEEYHNGWNKLDRLIKKFKKVHTITPAEAYFSHFGFYANPARSVLLDALSKHRKLEQVDIRKIIARHRQVKQSKEMDAIQSAIDITINALNKIRKNLKSYKNEHQIVADITCEIMHSGAKQHAYQPIIASGNRASTIHYIKNDQPINHGELVLFDVGAEMHNYSADISRTYSAVIPTKRQLQVYNSVKKVQTEAMNILKPGIDMKKYEQQVDKIMAKELKKLKLITDINDKKQLKKYYPHLTSHFLGLDTHDAADYKRPLEPGMVLTVEPGIYIPDEGIGVRIEDDILITKNGVKNLSASLSSDLF